MKINNSKLDAHLKKDLGDAYLVLNEEPVMLMEDRDRIRAALACDERHLFLVDSGFDPSEAMAETGSGSLFGGRTLFEFICAEALGAKVSDQICQIAQKCKDSGDAVIVASPGINRRGKWTEQLEEVFTVVTASEVPFARMPGWVAARAAKAGLQLNGEAAEMIANMTEGNLSMAAQEIEKLLIVHGTDETVDTRMVRDGLADQSRDDIQSLRESMADGDSLRSVRAVRNLKATKEAEVLVLWALAEEGKALLSLIDNGKPWGLFGEHRKNLSTLAHRLPRAEAEAYMAGVAKADWSVKGINRVNPWIRFERLACAFSLMARHNTIDKGLLA